MAAEETYIPKDAPDYRKWLAANPGGFVLNLPRERIGGGLLAKALLTGMADLGQQHEPDKAAKRYNVPKAAEGRARARRR